MKALKLAGFLIYLTNHLTRRFFIALIVSAATLLASVSRSLIHISVWFLTDRERAEFYNHMKETHNG
jgi:hypothetical protein